MDDKTEITQELLKRNGWKQIGDSPYFETPDMTIFCYNGFCCGLVTEKMRVIGSHFITVGELKDIARSLFKIELTFK